MLMWPLLVGGVCCTGGMGVPPFDGGNPFGVLTLVKPGVGLWFTAVKPPPMLTGVNPPVLGG